MHWARLELPEGRVCVANLHATAGIPERAAAEVITAAEHALAWAEGEPLIFGGDLNLRPARDPEVFEELRDRMRLAAPTGPGAIDHLLVRGLEVLERPRRLAPEERELVEPDGLRIRLSDHAPVSGTFALAR